MQSVHPTRSSPVIKGLILTATLTHCDKSFSVVSISWFGGEIENQLGKKSGVGSVTVWERERSFRVEEEVEMQLGKKRERERRWMMDLWVWERERGRKEMSENDEGFLLLYFNPLDSQMGLKKAPATEFKLSRVLRASSTWQIGDAFTKNSKLGQHLAFSIFKLKTDAMMLEWGPPFFFFWTPLFCARSLWDPTPPPPVYVDEGWDHRPKHSINSSQVFPV